MDHRRTVITAVAALLIVAAAACGDDDPQPTTEGPQPTASRGAFPAKLQAVADETVRHTPTIPGLLVHLEAPKRAIDVSVAAGFDDWAARTPLKPDAGVRIASNTKTFTAAAVLRLVETGAMSLDDPIAARVAPQTLEALQGDGYDVEAMTVRHLMLHDSGIYDYGTDPAYIAEVDAHPTRHWTRLDQLLWAMDHGDPLFEPGAAYAYSDTGYNILGEIIERVSTQPAAQAYRALLDFEGLGLDETYLESLEPVPPGAAGRAHQYFGESDGFDVDPSHDLYGAAGLVSTVDDLSAFYRALLRGEVFAEPGTLDTMLEIPPVNTEAQAGMGIFRDTVGSQTCWWNAGFWGTFVVTCPTIDVTIAASNNQAKHASERDNTKLLENVFSLVTDSDTTQDQTGEP